MVLMNFPGQVGLKSVGCAHYLDRRAAVKEMQLECETVSIKEDGGGEATINSICAPFNAQIPETGPPPVRVIPSAVVGGKESPGRIMDSAINHTSIPHSHPQ